MNAILIATIGYFLISLEAVASKFLLGAKIRSWKLYVFYVGLLSLLAFIFVPGFSLLFFGQSGLVFFGVYPFFVALLSGITFFIYLALLYKTLSRTTASRAYVFSGAISLVTTYILAGLFLKERFSLLDILGMACLLVGGTIIAIKVDVIRYPKAGKRKVKAMESFSDAMLAGIFLGISLVLLKIAYDQSGFINGYLFSRLGVTVSTMVMMFFVGFRREVISEISKHGKKEKAGQFSAVVLTKILAGTGTLLVNGAIFIGSVTLVNALLAVQYLFTFVFSLILTVAFGKVFAENLVGLNIIYKAIGVVLVVLGIILVSV